MHNTNDDSYHFTRPAQPGDVQGTSWHQQLAGEGRHGDYSAMRWSRRRAMQPGTVPLPPAELSMMNAGRVQAFTDAYERREAERPHVFSSAVGAYVGYQLVRRVLDKRLR